MNKQYWFRARANGFGWTPVTWSGWFVVLLWVFLVIIGARYSFMGVLATGGGAWGFIRLILAWSFVLLVVIWKKGEPLPFFTKRGDHHDEGTPHVK